MHARATFSESGPVFSSSNFGIKKTHSLARTVVVGLFKTRSLYDDRYHSDESFWNTPLLRGALRLSRMRFVLFLKRFFSRVASRKLITVGVFFFLFSLVFPQFQKNFSISQTTDTLCARKSKRRTRKKTNNKSPIFSLSDDKARQQQRR